MWAQSLPGLGHSMLHRCDCPHIHHSSYHSTPSRPQPCQLLPILRFQYKVPLYQEALCLVISMMSNSFVTPWTIVHQPPQSMGLSRQEYWSGLPFPAPGDLPDLGIEPVSPALADGFFTTESVISLLFVGCWLESWLCHVSAPPSISLWFFLYVFTSGKSFLLVFRLFS